MATNANSPRHCQWPITRPRKMEINAQGERNKLIKPHFMYEALGLTKKTRQTRYRELFQYNLEPGLVDEIREATNSNFGLGNDRFKEEISKALGRRVQPGKAGRPVKNEQ